MSNVASRPLHPGHQPRALRPDGPAYHHARARHVPLLRERRRRALAVRRAARVGRGDLGAPGRGAFPAIRRKTRRRASLAPSASSGSTRPSLMAGPLLYARAPRARRVARAQPRADPRATPRARRTARARATWPCPSAAEPRRGPASRRPLAAAWGRAPPLVDRAARVGRRCRRDRRPRGERQQLNWQRLASVDARATCCHWARGPPK